ncbi:succinylglutamate desuccinylase/aspartoacylase family protein [Oscillatoriales cyanobacterium LEGE 11467]|uniref:Succinylglutamate desuccinylase/aspartoacylase family protein n=1 Tax=Zarconia navalis LEGE 11467 TaxID=1828826 RepID=A0A928VYW8_9CYAN|nr:succinylglutamate desuccinylase/aspartoacylase family protein [Zarconia navalis]MBE9042732.1 succinylglutamate desuccinylase/aspartoacylase family protein [Zarconia navalis LEGE 11467]
MSSDLSIEIGGVTVPPASRQQIELPVARLPTQTMLSLPVIAINGAREGPTLWLSAAIHGDEINGVEIIRQVLQQILPQELTGTLIAVPIVNVFGFIEQSRYLPDRRDLNRSFPGSARGSLAARLAHLFVREIVNRSTHGIDLHTASDGRANLPQIRANLSDGETYRCAKAFGAPMTIHSTTRDGSLRQAATNIGIPVLLYEAGEALRFDADAISVGVEGVMGVMATLGMYPMAKKRSPNPFLKSYKTQWVRSPRSGILLLDVELGQQVTKKQKLGSIVDAFGTTNVKVLAPTDGAIVGLTKNPLVNQGDGIVHIAQLETESDSNTHSNGDIE